MSGAEQHAEVDRLLDMVRAEAGLIVSRGTDEDGEPLYGFVHRAFQEYFAALDVLNRYQREDDSNIIRNFLVDYVHDPHWQEVIFLLFGKLRQRFATNQLRFILAGKTRRSRYSSIIEQDLFFVANCLADGIVVDQDFADEVITKLGQVVRETPFPTQLLDAITVIMSLSRKKYYSEQIEQALQSIRHYFDNLDWQAKVAEAIYQSSSSASKGQHESIQLLNTLLQRSGPLMEKEVQELQENYSSTSLEKQHGKFQSLNQPVPNANADFETRLNLALLPFESKSNNFSERVQAIKILLMLTDIENARKLLEIRWQSPSLIETSRFDNLNKFISSIPAICELAEQDTIPLRARDQLYQLLCLMVPLFMQIDAVTDSVEHNEIRKPPSPKD